MAKIRRRIEHDYRELKTGLGLDHFEGRTWSGRHHHVTLVSVAHAFCTLERLNPKAPAAAGVPTGSSPSSSCCWPAGPGSAPPAAAHYPDTPSPSPPNQVLLALSLNSHGR
ncbi:hypothetical protein [Streptosporangium amethystogenes]|uniref:hypothetical protein n=1 Tax=Streptosporangium amethystogenes TaxID=2002 RepID=UPI003CCC2670